MDIRQAAPVNQGVDTVQLLGGAGACPGYATPNATGRRRHAAGGSNPHFLLPFQCGFGIVNSGSTVRNTAWFRLCALG